MSVAENTEITSVVPSVPASPPNADGPLLCRVAPNTALFLVSVLGLFLQVMLVRWVGTEVRVFAYMQNTILVVCFLGLGLGCFHCHEPIRLRWTVGSLAVLFGLLALPPTRWLLQQAAEWLGPIAQSLAWIGSDGPTHPIVTLFQLGAALVCVFGLMVLLCVCFIPIGQLIGRLMSAHPHIVTAYSVNIVGSLVGVWLFALLSWFYLPPVVWAGVAALLLVPFLLPARGADRTDLALTALGVLLAGAAAYEPQFLTVWWSPYQKLAVEKREPVVEHREEFGPFETLSWIKVNNAGYQAMVDRRPEHTQKRPDAFDIRQTGLSQYDIPFRLRPNAQNVLIAGAGSGNDAAGALRSNAKHITAVDIDPAIIALGRAYHPEHPYSPDFADRLKIVTDDARSFFVSSPPQQFDLVVFGLLDAHTTASLANARLDHYVYTRESIHQVHELMTKDGLLVLTFNQQHDYVIDRLAETLHREFGVKPMVFEIPENAYGFGGVMLVVGSLDAMQAVYRQQNQDAQLTLLLERWHADAVKNWREVVAKAEKAGSSPASALQAAEGARPWEQRLSYKVAPATDDWPYLYLRGPTIPVIFLILGAMLYLLLGVVKSLLGFRRLVDAWERSHWHFAFLGAAFLLLEVQNISRASVVLGNTWFVSAVIISGVLFMILCANLLAVLWPTLPRLPVYVALLGACLLVSVVDLTAFAGYPAWQKVLLVGGITTLPMLGSGLVFIASFRATTDKSAALGANLIGSLVGGLLESITYLTGVRALLLLVTLLYLAAILTAPPEREATTE